MLRCDCQVLPCAALAFVINEGTIYVEDSVSLYSLGAYLVEVRGSVCLGGGELRVAPIFLRHAPVPRALCLANRPCSVHGGLQVAWAFSIYLEAVAILPQLIVLQKDQVRTVILRKGGG